MIYVARKLRDWKLARKWRKVPKTLYPLRYTGSPIRIRKMPLEYGDPLVRVPGQRGAVQGRRYISSDGIERVLSPLDVEKR